MRKIILLAVCILSLYMDVNAQGYTAQMQNSVDELNKATTIDDYHKLGSDFSRIASGNKNEWLPYYYAAYCYAKIGWLHQYNPEKIEPFADQAAIQIDKALRLVEAEAAKKPLSEVYCVLSMINRARVFVNPVTQGSKYGPLAYNYAQKALEVNIDNPRAMYLDAWDKYNAPVAFGGDKKKARELLEKAILVLGGESPTDLNPHWGKEDCETLLKRYK
jgi:hypothetical protein